VYVQPTLGATVCLLLRAKFLGIEIGQVVAVAPEVQNAVSSLLALLTRPLGVDSEDEEDEETEKSKWELRASMHVLCRALCCMKPDVYRKMSDPCSAAFLIQIARRNMNANDTTSLCARFVWCLRADAAGAVYSLAMGSRDEDTIDLEAEVPADKRAVVE
jgi:hypothetical protein